MIAFKAPEKDEARNHHKGWLLVLVVIKCALAQLVGLIDVVMFVVVDFFGSVSRR